MIININSGQRFGRLTVLERSGTYRGYAVYSCRCDCGAQKNITGAHMASGRVRSCGCLRAQSQQNKSKRLALLKARARSTRETRTQQTLQNMADIFASVSAGLKNAL